MELRKFESGAVRDADADKCRYDLISPIGNRRLAETYAEGAKKYDDHNWQKGMPFSVLLNHVLGHINNYLRGERDEDHLAHAAWGLYAVMEFEETRPELNDLFFKPGVLAETRLTIDDPSKAGAGGVAENRPWHPIPACDDRTCQRASHYGPLKEKAIV
jgi:hypothetical protein